MTVDLPQPLRRILVVWGGLLFLLGGTIGRTQEPAAEEKKPQPVAEQKGDGPNNADQSQAEEDRQRRETERRAVTVGVLLLILVIVSGLTLVALVVLWGYRTRRLVRAPLPQQSLQDQLWYLKPPKEKIDDKPETDHPKNASSDSGEAESS